MPDNILDTVMDSTGNFRNYLTYSRGMSAIFARGAKKIIAYNELLEDEWEGRPSALSFLKDGNRMLEFLLNQNEKGAAFEQALTNGELLGVSPILEGVAGTLKNSSDWDVYVECKSQHLVQGDAFLLQNCLLELAQAVSGNGKDGKLLLGTTATELRSQELGMLHGELTPGEYVLLEISPLKNSGDGVDMDWEAYISAAELGMQTELCDTVPGFVNWIGAAAMHKGELFIHRDGIGSGALLALPACNAENDGDLRAKCVDGRMETILLVDDEDMIWDVVMNMLTEMGYNVLLAADGKEAVDIHKANKEQIDLILLDMLMPVMNAREAFHLMKAEEQGVKVLLASGYVDEEDVQDLLSAGAKGFMRKPYRLKDLVKKIRSILDKD